MGSPADLVERLDFLVGKDFERQVRCRFGNQVHHFSSSPRGSFLLLATFWRSIFCLMEESVALVLQSCLGGSARYFHVLEVSHNHFRLSVSCKAMGFFVYELRRVIGDCFDVYFHLWSNGAPHWEREKRLWEMEEARKWSIVLSRRQKRSAKARDKKVSFNPKLILDPPPKRLEPVFSKMQTLRFGSFSASIDPKVRAAKSIIIGSFGSFFVQPALVH
jgi:hypothetical protein